jgi:16S rRNA (cytidine1402-2'-O)-methyltransferase
METPYRNNKLLRDLIDSCHPDSFLCIATDLTLDSEYVKTRQIRDWKKQLPDLHKRPTIFILQGQLNR